MAILSGIPVPRSAHKDGQGQKSVPGNRQAPKSRRAQGLRDRVFKSLPSASGPYDIGNIDLEIPLDEAINFGLVRNGVELLCIESILVTVYYPIALGVGNQRAPDGKKQWSRQTWLPRSRSSSARGYGDFAGISKLFTQCFFTASVGLTKLPAWRNAPIAQHWPYEANAHEEGDGVKDRQAKFGLDRTPRFPLMLFSHGLGGNRTTYSSLCGEFASYGIICCAVEHRDGSGPRTFVNFPDERRVPRRVDYLYPEDGKNDTDNNIPTDHNMRNRQIQMRKRELHETWKIMCAINDGKGAELAKRNLRIKPRRQSRGGSHRGTIGVNWDEWKGMLNVEDVIMCGHSFGGATSISALRTPEMLEYVKYGILLDIWGQGLPPEPLKGEVDHIPRPIIGIGSESFLYWEENLKLMFDLFKDTAENGQQVWLSTVRGSFHLSFSDFGLLWPHLFKFFFKTTVDPQRAIDIIIESSLEFLQEVMPPMQARWIRSSNECLLKVQISDKWREIEGRRNDWKGKMQVHGGDDKEIWMHLSPDSGYAGIEGTSRHGTDATARQSHISNDGVGK